MTHASTQRLEPWSIDPREIEVCRDERGPIRLGHGGYGAVRPPAGHLAGCSLPIRPPVFAAHRPIRLRCSGQGAARLHARDRLAFCCQATACSSPALAQNFTMRGLGLQSAHKHLFASTSRAALSLWVFLLRQPEASLDMSSCFRSLGCGMLPDATPSLL